MAEDGVLKETEREISEEQEASHELVIGWQVLFFDLVLWIFVPDEFRVGQYFVTMAAIIGAVVGITLVLIGTHRRRKAEEAALEVLSH